MPAEILDWVANTPAESAYRLVMLPGAEEDCRNALERVDLTRAEYIALKNHLAALRGYTVGDFRLRIANMVGNAPEGYDSDEQQIAAHLETARAFYRHCPELVVSMSPDLIKCIAELAE